MSDLPSLSPAAMKTLRDHPERAAQVLPFLNGTAASHTQGYGHIFVSFGQRQADYGLNFRSYKVYVALLTYANSTSRLAWPTFAQLATSSGVSEKTVQRAIADLEDSGLVRKVAYKQDWRGMRSGLVYFVPEPLRPSVA